MADRKFNRMNFKGIKTTGVSNPDGDKAFDTDDFKGSFLVRDGIGIRAYRRFAVRSRAGEVKFDLLSWGKSGYRPAAASMYWVS